jgi:hypothetical protein
MFAPVARHAGAGGARSRAIRQDFGEHPAGHRELGQLESDIASMAGDLAPILISFSRKLVSDQFRRLRHRQRAHEFPRL